MYISYDNSPTFKVTIWDSPCEAPSLVRSSEDPVMWLQFIQIVCMSLVGFHHTIMFIGKMPILSSLCVCGK